MPHSWGAICICACRSSCIGGVVCCMFCLYRCFQCLQPRHHHSGRKFSRTYTDCARLLTLVEIRLLPPTLYPLLRSSLSSHHQPQQTSHPSRAFVLALPSLLLPRCSHGQAHCSSRGQAAKDIRVPYQTVPTGQQRTTSTKDWCCNKLLPSQEAMTHTKQTSSRKLDDFPTLQLFLLGKFIRISPERHASPRRLTGLQPSCASLSPLL